MAKPITKQYPISQEQLYMLALDAAINVNFTIENKDEQNFCFTVKTGFNMYSVSGSRGNVICNEITQDKAEIVFGGATAGSTAGNLLTGQVFMLGGAKPIAKKMIKYMEKKIANGEIPKVKTKKCPFCSEKIKVDAKICMYCKKDV